MFLFTLFVFVSPFHAFLSVLFWLFETVSLLLTLSTFTLKIFPVCVCLARPLTVENTGQNAEVWVILERKKASSRAWTLQLETLSSCSAAENWTLHHDWRSLYFHNDPKPWRQLLPDPLGPPGQKPLYTKSRWSGALLHCLHPGGDGGQLLQLLSSLLLWVRQLHGLPLHPAAARPPVH